MTSTALCFDGSDRVRHQGPVTIPEDHFDGRGIATIMVFFQGGPGLWTAMAYNNAAAIVNINDAEVLGRVGIGVGSISEAEEIATNWLGAHCGGTIVGSSADPKRQRIVFVVQRRFTA